MQVKEPKVTEENFKNTTRHFDEIWSELENRHAWIIKEDSYDNPRPAMSKISNNWMDYDNRYAVEFREQNHLEDVIEGAQDDWEAILRLRHWVFNNMINGTNASIGSLNPSALLGVARAGGSSFCTHFAAVFVATATSLGFVARKLGIDKEHTEDEASSMHGVVDIWVDSLGKWVSLDPNYDHHYELNGVPLNTEEICQQWQKNKGSEIKILVGPKKREVSRARGGSSGIGEAQLHFWHHIETNNNMFRRDGHGNREPTVLLVDEARKKQQWYQGRPPNTSIHSRYAKGTFLITEDVDDAYPDLNAAYFELLPPHKMPYYCRVQFYTPCSPNFSHYEVCVDGELSNRIDGGEYPWRLHPGKCSFEVCAINLAGHRGSAYKMSLIITEDAGKKPTWPDQFPRGHKY